MKRAIFIIMALLLLGGWAAAEGQQEAYPDKPITLICPWAAGGGTDRTARFIADELSEVIGQPVQVSNKTGGNGAVGHQAAANAKADGYTIGNLTFEVCTLKYLGYSDITPEDYIPILQFNQDAAAVLVDGDAPYDNVKELLDAIREEPAGTFRFSGSGTGTVWDLARIGLLNEVGIDPDRVKYIPTKGAAPAITEMMGGHVDVITCSYPEAAPQVEAGKIKCLGIMANERNSQFDEVPTLKEQGIDWSYGTWRGLAVPLDTPQERVEILRESILEVVESDAYKEFMNKNGFGIKIRDGEEYMDFMMDTYRGLEEIFEISGYGE